MSRGEDRRQARAAQSDMKKFYYIFGAVAAVGVGVVGFQVSSSMFQSAVSAPIALDLQNDEELVALAQGITAGQAGAPVTIVEFGDYSCPGCGSFALSVRPQIDQTLVASGKVKFVFYDFPLVSIHPNSFLAARAARCANELGNFWPYHETLFRNQARWAAASMPASAFEQYADEAGLDADDFGSCLNSDDFADVVSANMELGGRMGVSGTPSIFINANGQTRRLNNYDFASINEAVEMMTAPVSR